MKFFVLLFLSGFFLACNLLEDIANDDFSQAREFDLELINADLNQGIPAGSNFAIQSLPTGLSIDSTNGQLSFNSLANFAKAGGELISITYTDSDGSSQTFQVSLKVKAANKAELENLVDLFINDSGIGPTGNYNAIDTSQVTDMSWMFSDGIYENGDLLDSFNGDIRSWNTSKVTNMRYMFWGAYAFNQDISSWNTSKVIDMNGMFAEAAEFDKDISSWNTSKVTNMNYMFFAARVFNQPLNNWDTSKVTDMSEMFAGAYAFNQPLNNWDTSKVTDMSEMFSYTDKFNQNISSWNTSNVTDMSDMFLNTDVFNQDISSWNTSNVTDMSGMFSYTDKFNQNISGWDVQAAKDNLTDMFLYATAFNNANSNGATTEPENYFKVLKNN